MRAWLVDFVACPECRGRLALRPARLLTYRGTDDRRIQEGILRCGACERDYPIIGSIPRLVPPEQLTADEHAAAERLARHEGAPEEEVVSPLTAEQIQERLEQMARSGQEAPAEDTAYLRKWSERGVTYLVHHAGERTKHVWTVRPYLEQPIGSIVEVGGGAGGYLGNFMRETGAPRGVIVELLESSCKMALVREPQTEVVRGDAHALPFAQGVFDLVISSMVLEHLSDWRRGVLEMARIARQGYITYSPNGHFPYDHGHLDAPVHAWMPRSLAVSIAYFFNRLRRTGRTRDNVRQTLDALNLVPRRRLTRFLLRHGVSSCALFERLMRFSVLEGQAHTAAGAKRMLRAHPHVAWLIGRALTLLGAEPVVSLYIKSDQQRREQATAGTAPEPA